MKTPNPNQRKAEVQSLKDTIQDLLRAYRLNGKLTQTRILESWAELVGGPVAQKTTQLYFSKGKLFVRLSSAPLRHQLYLGRAEIQRRVNEAAGEALIDEVVFL